MAVGNLAEVTVVGLACLACIAFEDTWHTEMAQASRSYGHMELLDRRNSVCLLESDQSCRFLATDQSLRYVEEEGRQGQLGKETGLKMHSARSSPESVGIGLVKKIQAALQMAI